MLRTLVSAVRVRTPYSSVFVRSFATGPRYTPSHEWISLDQSGVGTVGITDFAQNALGDVVYVELPEVGKKVAAKGTMSVVESVKAASDVYSPVSGTVVEVNSKLADQPSMINKSATTDGWMVKLKVDNPKDVEKLLDQAAYDKHTQSEKH
eukprot:TRINITY_DN1037_c0_g1_i1.p1 TRINITY_DN1037_c0_g1~~TRINITY_DN1037_c0_g1_i1.p1  ORF type:complete len:166 (+),score=42.85 TRINITY_DN1037_c0_g1_i1:48-500(+)